MQSTRPENSSLKIDQHGRFFSKLLSKEASAANSSSRILYYDGAVRAVPFVWETCPGTPKRLPPPLPSYSFESADAYNCKPFLTPPPYYLTRLGSKLSENGFDVKMQRGPRFLSPLLSMLSQKRSAASPRYSVSSSQSSSSSSSWLSSMASSPPPAQKNKSFRERYVLFPCSRFEGGDEDAVGQDHGGSSPVSTLVGFGPRRKVNCEHNRRRNRRMCF